MNIKPNSADAIRACYKNPRKHQLFIKNSFGGQNNSALAVVNTGAIGSRKDISLILQYQILHKQ